MIDVSAIITLHREGDLARRSFASLDICIQEAAAAGIAVERIVVLDRADEATRAVVAAHQGCCVIETDCGDQGSARNAGIAESSASHIAFLDGDDLWGYNWLTKAFNACLVDPERIIAHPQVNWLFGESADTLIGTGADEALFDAEFFRFSNYWDVMCLAPRKAYIDVPFQAREIAIGFAYEDWHWNCVTMEAGYAHRIVPDTIHFKRRRSHSQTIESALRGALPRPTQLFSYGWYNGGRNPPIDESLKFTD